MKIHNLEFSTPTIVFPYSERSCFFTTMSTVTACTQVNLKLLIMFLYSALLLKAVGPCTHIYIPGFWQWEPRFSSVFLRDTFTWHAAAEKHTGFCISHSPEGRKQQRLSNCCCLPSGFDFIFSLVTSALIGWKIRERESLKKNKKSLGVELNVF